LFDSIAYIHFYLYINISIFKYTDTGTWTLEPCHTWIVLWYRNPTSLMLKRPHEGPQWPQFMTWKSGSSDKSGDMSPLVIAVMSQLLGCKFHHGTLNPKKPTCSRRSHGQGAKVAWSSGVMVPELRNWHWRNLGMGQNMSKPENKCIFVLPFTSYLKYLGYQSFDPDGMIYTMKLGLFYC